MCKVHVLPALILCFYKNFCLDREQRNVLSVLLCQEMSGFSCHPEECNPRPVIILLSVNCFPDGIMDNNSSNLPIFWLKILSNVSSSLSSRYFCITLRILQTWGDGGRGEREENWINSHHRYQITEADMAWTQVQRFRFCPPSASVCYPGLGLGLSLPPVPKQSRCREGQSTREAAGEPGEKHATRGTGDNENETGENESISTPHTGLLTPHQYQAYTRGQRPGFTCKSSCINAACTRTLRARSVYTVYLVQPCSTIWEREHFNAI